MKRFFVQGSARDVTSLGALKILLNSKQVSSNVNKHYYAIDLFLDKVLDGYLQAYTHTHSDESGKLPH